MRDLACCANGVAFHSTPSDLVRFALATNPRQRQRWARRRHGDVAGCSVVPLAVTRAHSPKTGGRARHRHAPPASASV